MAGLHEDIPEPLQSPTVDPGPDTIDELKFAVQRRMIERVGGLGHQQPDQFNQGALFDQDDMIQDYLLANYGTSEEFHATLAQRTDRQQNEVRVALLTSSRISKSWRRAVAQYQYREVRFPADNFCGMLALLTGETGKDSDTFRRCIRSLRTGPCDTFHKQFAWYHGKFLGVIPMLSNIKHLEIRGQSPRIDSLLLAARRVNRLGDVNINDTGPTGQKLILEGCQIPAHAITYFFRTRPWMNLVRVELLEGSVQGGLITESIRRALPQQGLQRIGIDVPMVGGVRAGTLAFLAQHAITAVSIRWTMPKGNQLGADEMTVVPPPRDPVVNGALGQAHALHLRMGRSRWLEAIHNPLNLTTLTLEGFAVAMVPMQIEFLSRHPNIRKLALQQVCMGAHDENAWRDLCDAIAAIPELRTLRLAHDIHARAFNQLALREFIIRVPLQLEALDLDVPRLRIDLLVIEAIRNRISLRKLRMRLEVPANTVEFMATQFRTLLDLQVLDGDDVWALAARFIIGGHAPGGREIRRAWDSKADFV